MIETAGLSANETPPAADKAAGILVPFLQIFLPVAILIIFGGWLLAQSSIENTLHPNLHNETDFVKLANFSLQQELATPARHVRSLVNEQEVQEFYRNQSRGSHA